LIERKKQRSYSGCLLFAVVLVLGGFLAWRWMHFNQWRQRLPAGMTLAGVPVEGATRQEAVERLLGAYDGPIVLHFQEQRLSIHPQNVAFQIDVDATVAGMDAELAKYDGFNGYLKYLLGQRPDPVDVAVQATYSSQALEEFLSELALQYDRPARPPVPQISTYSYAPGEPGYHLDVAASVPVVQGALLSTSQREATLVVQVEEPPLPDFALLSQIIDNEVIAFSGIASVFAKDLQSGAEININSDVAYAGMSVIKIGILLEAYRYLDQPPNAEVTKNMTETMTVSGNFSANLLLRLIGEGDTYRGAEIFTTSMHRLGLVNTFMATPYDEEVPPPVIVTPANSRTDLNTQPDPYMQTTPADMGLLLEMVYQCRYGGGVLSLVYPEDVTAQECQAMIDHMLANQLSGEDEVPVLIAAGLPSGTPIAHKHGWVDDTRGNAALIFTPGGDYVLVIYLYRPGWVDWDQTNSFMTRISRLVYAFFNPPPTSSGHAHRPGRRE
jgi:beta-lactamase class A